MQGFRQILLRDLRLAVRQGMDAFMAVTFFVIAGALFPLGVGPEPGVLAPRNWMPVRAPVVAVALPTRSRLVSVASPL